MRHEQQSLVIDASVITPGSHVYLFTADEIDTIRTSLDSRRSTLANLLHDKIRKDPHLQTWEAVYEKAITRYDTMLAKLNNPIDQPG